MGLAAAEKHLAARFNKEDNKIIDHYTYALVTSLLQTEVLSTSSLGHACLLTESMCLVLCPCRGIRRLQTLPLVAWPAPIRQAWCRNGILHVLSEMCVCLRPQPNQGVLAWC